jgi:O-antigen ligase
VGFRYGIAHKCERHVEWQGDFMTSRNLPSPPPPFLAISAAALAAILFWVILATWVPDHWCFGFAEAAVLALGAAWAIRFALRPYSLRASPVLIPITGTVVIGLVQLMTAHTANRWETWNAVLRWSVYLTAFFLASQICASPIVSIPFRRALLYFGFVIGVVSVLQFFTSPGKVFWLFESEYQADVLGPFVSRDHYAAFIELILPIALFEALSDRRKTLFGAVAAGTMVASVIAGASRAGSILVVLESAAVLLLASRRGVRSARRVSGVFAALLVVCSVAFTAVVGWTQLWERFQDPNPYRYRREMLISAVAMARAKPWTGFGLGTFETVYPGYAIFDIGMVVDHAHNDWAEWAAEGGLPFLACLLAVAFWSTPKLLHSLWGLGVLAVLLHGLADFPMQKPALALWVFVLLGGACAQHAPPNRPPNPRPLRRVPVSG